MPSKTPPPPPLRQPRRPGGYRIRADLDDALRRYQMQTGAKRVDIIDAALETYLAARHVWPPKDS